MTPKPKPIRCGGCGAKVSPATASPKSRRYNSLCGRCRVPHQLVSRLRDGVDAWRCDYCGQQGSMSQLENTDCTHYYPPCSSCGQHPFCAPDCPGIAEALSDASVYVAGFGGTPKH
jgi:hypothetical protein